MGDLALAQVAELLLRCASERRRLEGDTLHCWVTRQDLATHLEETGEKRGDGGFSGCRVANYDICDIYIIYNIYMFIYVCLYMYIQ